MDKLSKILCLQDNGGGKVCQWAAIGYFPLSFHRLGRPAKEGLISLAANQRKVLIASSCLLIDDLGKLFLSFG